MLRAALAAEAIEVLTPPEPSIDTGHCIVLVTADGERTFVTWPGAERRLDVACLADMRAGPQDQVVSTGYMVSDRSARRAILDWLETGAAGCGFVFDPSPVIAELSEEFADKHHALFLELSA